MISLYAPGDTLLHRTAAAPKLAALLLAGLGIAFVTTPAVLAPAAAAGAALLAAARPPRGLVVAQARGLAVIVAVVVALTALTGSARDGLVFALRVVALVTAATAVTATTRTADMQDVIERTLRRLGPPGRRMAERTGLAVALVVRFVPELVAHAAALDEARKARGLEVSPVRLLVPMLVRTLRTADAVAEALDARGYPGDRPDASDRGGGPTSHPAPTRETLRP